MSIAIRVLLVAVAALLVTVAYFRWVSNPQIMDRLKTDPSSPEAERVLVLTLPSGRQIPVNYLLEGDQLYLGSDFGWWRELVDARSVTACVRAREVTGVPRVVLDDPEYRDAVFSRLRPNAQWLPEWLEAHLIVVSLVNRDAAGPCR